MAVPMEALQAMLSEMQRLSAENLQTIMKQQMEAFNHVLGASRNNAGMMTDSRGIGRPVVFKGDEAKYAEWKAKLLAYLRVSNPDSSQWIAWAASCDATVTEEDLDLVFPNTKQEMLKFALNLYSVLLSCTEDDPFRICHSVKEGNGLEAMRLLMKRYEPRTPGTKRALLKAIINNAPAKKPEELEKNLMKVEEYMKKYELMAGNELPEDLKVTVIIDLCTKDLKEHLELSTRDMTYKQVRDEVISYAERKRNTFSNDLKAMDVDECYEAEATFWGGKAPYHDAWEYTEGELYSMSGHKGYSKGGPKGGHKGDLKGSFKGNYKGQFKGYSKGDSKGMQKGDGKGQIGKAGGFMGYCHWCGEWGHSQSRCPAKDEYVDGVRQSKGKGKGSYRSADSIEESGDHGSGKDTLESLEKTGGFRTLCSLEHRCPHRCVNRFTALSPNDEDFEEADAGIKTVRPPGLTLGDFIPVMGKKAKSKVKKADIRASSPEGIEAAPKLPTKTKKAPVPIVDLLDLMCVDVAGEVNTVNDCVASELIITIDSGASENVISAEAAPQAKILASQGSREGVRYVAANGDTMPERGGEAHPGPDGGPQVLAQRAGRGREAAFEFGGSDLRCRSRGYLPF